MIPGRGKGEPRGLNTSYYTCVLDSHTGNLYFLRLRLVLLATVVAAVAASPTIPLAAKAMYNPDLFQGDIKGIAGQQPGVRQCSLAGKATLGMLPQTWHRPTRLRFLIPSA